MKYLPTWTEPPRGDLVSRRGAERMREKAKNVTENGRLLQSIKTTRDDASKRESISYTSYVCTAINLANKYTDKACKDNEIHSHRTQW
jgi:hypothetical protein